MKVERLFDPSFDETLEILRHDLNDGTLDDFRILLHDKAQSDPRLVRVAERIVGDVPEPVEALYDLIQQSGENQIVPTFNV